ncbi:MAG TPA: phosphoribosyl-ATP pyrophosphatase, partial [Leptospiraceae bacterium]|nr:phosphoribosyl-ATP pyrophosphatase [Leptospiraceae bacterium]
MEFLLKLEEILKDRKAKLPEKSYTAELFKSGIDR